MNDIGELRACAICFEAFQKPKILNCGHTFCKGCLKEYLKKTLRVKGIKCPLCRKNHLLGDRGIEEILDNFVVSLPNPGIQEKCPCGICFKNAVLKECSHCDLKLCPQCKPSHRLALQLSNIPYESDSSDVEDIVDDSDITDDAALPFQLHDTYSGQTMVTKYNSLIVSRFQMNLFCPPEEGLPNYIHCINPINSNCCQVIANLGPEVVIYDDKGLASNRRFFESGIADIINTNDGRIMFCNFHVHIIVVIETCESTSRFADTGDCQPTSISSLSDGRIVCVGPKKVSTKHNGDGTPYGALQIYHKNGVKLKQITSGKNGKLFTYPLKVSVNKFDDSIVVSDRDKHCVFIFDKNCTLMNKYQGRQLGNVRLPLLCSTEFAPHALCHDMDGNIIVANLSDGTLHVLRPNGFFVGYIVTREHCGLGMPMSICCDNLNRFWLGDKEDGTIRIIEISSFKNTLDPVSTQAATQVSNACTLFC